MGVGRGVDTSEARRSLDCPLHVRGIGDAGKAQADADAFPTGRLASPDEGFFNCAQNIGPNKIEAKADVGGAALGFRKQRAFGVA